jgi:hypothetical protein
VTRRRITYSLSAAAGGLLGAAFLPATAFGDTTFDYANYDFSPANAGVVEDGGIRNFLVDLPPAATGSVQGYQDLNVFDPVSNAYVGTVGADVDATADTFGNSNELILITSDPTGPVGTAAGDLPPVGSIFDTFTYTSGITAVYTDIPDAGPGGANLVTYTIETPSGNLDIPISFDAIAAVVPVNVDGAGAFTGDRFVVAGPESIGGVNGISPTDYDLLGTQTFDVDNASGTQIGTFTADVANSSDILGNTTQDMLVTSSSGDAPPVGSVYQYFFFTGTASGDSEYNVYADIPSTTGGADTITDTLVSPGGSSNVPIDFDAAAGLAGVLNGESDLANAISIPTVYDITPATTGTIVGIDGIQPEDVEVDGYQQFNWDNLATGQTGIFDADVAQSTIIFGNTTQEQLVVTQDVSGHAPGVGSVFEVNNYGSGVENIYSDIVSTTGGPNTILDTWVTPFGTFNVPDSYDAAATLAGASFQNMLDPGAQAAAADLLSILDPSAVNLF